MKNNGKFEVCYNMQTAVDGKNKLIINYDVVSVTRVVGEEIIEEELKWLEQEHIKLRNSLE